MFEERVILLAKSKETYADAMQELYVGNMGLIYKLSDSMGVSKQDRLDFYQLAYLALDDAVKAYNPDGNFTFMSYFRRCLLHQHYVFKLNSKFPMRVSASQYSEANNLIRQVDISECMYSSLDDQLLVAEDKALYSTLWDAVDRVLDEKNSYVIHSRFEDERTLEDIAKDLCIGKDRVRRRECRSLRKLSTDRDIQNLAKDYFDINIKDN